MISHTFRGAGTSVARVRGTARYASASRVGRASTQRIVQRDFAHFSWRWNKRSASSLDGALRKRDRGWDGRFCGLRGRFAHAHYRFRKRALLVPSRCDLIPGTKVSFPLVRPPKQQRCVCTREINRLARPRAARSWKTISKTTITSSYHRGPWTLAYESTHARGLDCSIRIAMGSKHS